MRLTLKMKLCLFKFNRDRHKNRIIKKFNKLSKEDKDIYLKAIKAIGMGNTGIYDLLMKAHKAKEN